MNDVTNNLAESVRMGSKEFVASIRRATAGFRIMAICQQLRDIMKIKAKEVGWAIATHGSFRRDLDILAVPWTDDAVSEEDFVESMRRVMETTLGGKALIGVGDDPQTPGYKTKPHGRRCWTIHSTSERLVEDERGAHPYIDLSIVDTRNI